MMGIDWDYNVRVNRHLDLRSARMSPRTIRAVLALAVVLTLCTSGTLWGADAAAIYKEKCQKCHGADGKGDTPAGKKFKAMDFARPEVQKASDADLIKIMDDGKEKMPSYKGKLSDADIKALVAYCRSLGKK
jgi:cytochrome c5